MNLLKGDCLEKLIKKFNSYYGAINQGRICWIFPDNDKKELYGQLWKNQRSLRRVLFIRGIKYAVKKTLKKNFKIDFHFNWFIDWIFINITTFGRRYLFSISKKWKIALKKN